MFFESGVLGYIWAQATIIMVPGRYPTLARGLGMAGELGLVHPRNEERSMGRPGIIAHTPGFPMRRACSLHRHENCISRRCHKFLLSVEICAVHIWISTAS
jgi:hypothetical protein